MKKSAITIFLLLEVFMISSCIALENPNMITTQMTVNGIDYDAICDCGKEVTQQIKTISEMKCTPTKLKIRQDREARKVAGQEKIDLDIIRDIMGKPKDVTFVDPHLTSFKCIDGRYTKPSLYTLGGDAGEFFLGLVIYEELIGSELTSAQVRELLMDYIDQMDHDKFHWWTDDKAIQHLESVLDEDSGIDIQDPNPTLRDSILNVISEPYNIGDVHFKTLLNQYEKLNIRKGLVEIFIKQFYHLLWNKDEAYSNKIQLQQLVGSHKEAAFIDIRQDKSCNAPLLKANNKELEKSTFFYHHEAVKVRRSQIAYFFTQKLNKNDPEK